ncbi:MAG: hypothetical protein KDK62_07245 [Chlamydiia bacterium]|nr:hypothetical protein [Chlamydiia bacterium]
MEQHYQISRKKAEAISTGVFLIALGVLFYFNYWWPGILLAIWAFLGTRQSLTGRHFDFAVSSIILLGLFVVITFDISWSVLGPLLFVIGGAYMIFREYFFATEGSKPKGLEEKEPEVYEEEE